MSTVALYRSAKGVEVTHGSYSSRETYHFCPRKFQLRNDGWQQREKRASTYFGHAIEDALKMWERDDRRPHECMNFFTLLWNEVKALKEFDELTYTESEGDWQSLLRAGQELALLYEIRVPDLPISVNPKAKWSQRLEKKIFPGTELSVLTNLAYLDIISFPAWDHPLLPPIEQEWTKWEGHDAKVITRTLIIDCKTSGKDLNTELIALDPQLVEYAWQYRKKDVGFLWLVKRGHALERRDKVTLLWPRGEEFPQGAELNVLGIDKERDIVHLGDRQIQEAYYRRVKGMHPSSKAYAAAEQSFFSNSFVLTCPRLQVTKQRLQFAAARLTDQDLDEAGREIGRTTLEQLRAHQEQFYPRTGGIRWPNEKCVFCEMRGICADKPELRDRILTRSGEEWMNARPED